MIYTFDMKKVVIVLLSIFFIFCCNFIKINEVVYASDSQFARVLKSGVKLYKEPVLSEEMDNVYFEIPRTYFVELLENGNDYFYKAKYIDVIGYVRKTDVQCVLGSPKQPYASEISFRIYSLNGLNLRSEPSQEKGLFSVVISIPFMSTDLQFYGEVQGEEAISYKGTTWYYCRYVKDGAEYYGYVYSIFCDQKTELEENVEILEYISEPNFAVKPNPDMTEKVEQEFDFASFSGLKQALIIIAVCVPCFIIVYLLFKPTKIAVSALESNGRKVVKRKKFKKKRNQDYYEYE